MATGFKQKSIADQLFETNYQTKVAAEFWLNIGGKEFRLVGRVIRLGRALDNDIVLEDKSCSRYHALLTITSRGALLEDLKSRNGVRVNGDKINKIKLDDNDEIEIGDLKGIFYQRIRNSDNKSKEASAEATQTKNFNEEEIDPYTDDPGGAEEQKSVLSKFQDLNPKAKLAAVAMLPLIIFFFLLMAAGSKKTPTRALVANTTPSTINLSEDQIVKAELNKDSFNNCLEYEDLGNFKQARKCLGLLPLTKEVYEALTRVVKRQDQLTELRFKEGQQAYENYYFDLAIVKWQEVLLIADESSKFLEQARNNIEDAKEKKAKL